ncbi:MAG: hypothetical protein AVDCRST_MAG22-530 [uncultured Rubrobacteraceae bacterium]|uniref:Apea-like HEPN domain-containing protein n=1 Tax=uncultured Rubrobacteraceae bacterium TaxID=349277 RepID=A0A6J4NMH3_9ACTN|nr:MAG: hypothetical protein AVDCRST_MAG22-530 [uncultured Rubrobacteraceae bacterium]
MQVDDLLLSERGPEHGSVLVERADVRGTLQRGTLALRLKDGRLSPEYLMEYLNSATARTLVAATTVSLMQGVMTRIAVERLREIPVPLVSISTFEDLDSVETELRAKADELSTLRRSLFEARDARAFREQLGELTRLGSMLSTSIESSGQLQFQISNAYPYPIAYGYRLLNSYAGPWERYLEQLRVAENMLAFLASLSLSILQKEDLAAAGIDIGKLWEGGVAFGSWKRVIEKCAGVFESYRNHPLASALAGLDIASGKRGFGADVNALISARNNLGHGREAFAEVAIRRASNEAQERLHRCMEALAFLIAFPIYQVQDMDLNDDGIRLDLKCLLYRGDHPGLEQRIVVSPRAEKKNRLFIDLGGATGLRQQRPK